MTRRIVFALSLCTALLFTTATASASPYGGRHIAQDYVSGYSTDSYSHLTFRAGERSVVSVQGNGYTALQVRVFDENGNLITQDVCQQDACVVAWTPRWNGGFRITIQNLGGYANRYSMVVD